MTVKKRARRRTRPARRKASVRKHAFTRGLYGWITHTDLSSHDPGATKTWCAKVLGWKFGPSFPGPGGVRMQASGTWTPPSFNIELESAGLRPGLRNAAGVRLAALARDHLGLYNVMNRVSAPRAPARSLNPSR